jgi:hypothetical protein
MEDCLDTFDEAHDSRRMKRHLGRRYLRFQCLVFGASGLDVASDSGRDAANLCVHLREHGEQQRSSVD